MTGGGSSDHTPWTVIRGEWSWRATGTVVATVVGSGDSREETTRQSQVEVRWETTE